MDEVTAAPTLTLTPGDVHLVDECAALVEVRAVGGPVVGRLRVVRDSPDAPWRVADLGEMPDAEFWSHVASDVDWSSAAHPKRGYERSVTKVSADPGRRPTHLRNSSTQSHI